MKLRQARKILRRFGDIHDAEIRADGRDPATFDDYGRIPVRSYSQFTNTVYGCNRAANRAHGRVRPWRTTTYDRALARCIGLFFPAGPKGPFVNERALRVHWRPGRLAELLEAEREKDRTHER